MKLAAIAKLIKAAGNCKLYKVFYDDCRTYDLYIGTKTAIFPLTGFPKAQNESELATLLGISKKEWADIEFDNDCPDDLHHAPAHTHSVLQKRKASDRSCSQIPQN